MSKKSSAQMGGPLSMGFPDPFMTRPKQSSDTANRMDEPENETRVALVSTPVVPSKTYMDELVHSGRPECELEAGIQD